MFPQRVPPKPTEDCEIEIKKTRTGKKIKFHGKCSKEQIQIAREENGIGEE